MNVVIMFCKDIKTKVKNKENKNRINLEACFPTESAKKFEEYYS